MTDSFSALPETAVITFNPEDPNKSFWTPVVGWTRGLAGFDPVTVIMGDGHMVHGKAIVVQSGSSEYVVDPNAKKTFYSVVDWLEYMKGAKPVSKPNRHTGVRRRTNLFIQFGTKVFINKSFWHFKTPKDEFLFAVEGGGEAPEDPRVQKINRDAFYKARKLLEVVPFEELFNTLEIEADEVDQEAEDLI